MTKGKDSGSDGDPKIETWNVEIGGRPRTLKVPVGPPEKGEPQEDGPSRFAVEMARMSRAVNDLAHDKGFWDFAGVHDVRRGGPEVVACKLALIHSEISEALEAFREGDGEDRKIKGHSKMCVELADAVIRILDLSHELRMDLGAAILAKHAYNKSRPFKHGKAF